MTPEPGGLAFHTFQCKTHLWPTFDIAFQNSLFELNNLGENLLKKGSISTLNTKNGNSCNKNGNK
ncbi:hypothetical protein EGI22_14340 [Lacihabitans sp. LS3-19]|nr:hypothetical protein [Lacihabitans sp. LS3-19]